MKDEEIAEEYAKNLKARDFIAKPKEIVAYFAFLAGLKAGKPCWHDLRKDKNDLPKNKRNVWCYYGDGYGKGFYDKDDGSWLIEGHLYCSIIDAWCELPTFDKESGRI
jgi:hypothetical protein